MPTILQTLSKIPLQTKHSCLGQETHLSRQGQIFRRQGWIVHRDG